MNAAMRADIFRSTSRLIASKARDISLSFGTPSAGGHKRNVSEGPPFFANSDVKTNASKSPEIYPIQKRPRDASKKLSACLPSFGHDAKMSATVCCWQKQFEGLDRIERTISRVTFSFRIIRIPWDFNRFPNLMTDLSELVEKGSNGRGPRCVLSCSGLGLLVGMSKAA